MGNETVNLLWMLFSAPEERKDGSRHIAGLAGHHRPVDRPAIDPGRGTGLQAPDAKLQLAQARGEAERCRIARAPALVVVEPDVDAAAEEGAHGEHHGPGADLDARDRDDAAHLAPLDHEVGGLLLKERQVRLALEERADRLAVELAVGLRTRRPHRGSLARIQGAELNPGAVGGARHRAPEGVDLAHQVSLADPADRRVAAHGAECLDALRQKERAHAHARRGQRRLGAGVSATDDDDVAVKVLRARHERSREEGRVL
jgi:hypothetical protein